MNRKYAITERLSSLQSWRYAARGQIEQVQTILREHNFLDADAELALDGLSKRVSQERVTIGFIAEPDRGKSDLINALFFGDLPRPLLPTRMGFNPRCVTEVRFDSSQKTSIRLLPIETRESPRRLTDFIDDEREWRVILFDPNQQTSIVKALAALAETRRISLVDAVAWGMHAGALKQRSDPQSEGGRQADADLQTVDVPRWRHAIINYPHPLLDAGLVVIDAPGAAAIATEPELRRERLPAADALVMIASIEAGITKPELATWKDYFGGGRQLREREREHKPTEHQQIKLVALNYIELLRDENTDADPKSWLREIDSRSQAIADLLHVDLRNVIPVSSALAVQGCFSDDGDAMVKSRLYQLERALTNKLSDSRQVALTDEIIERLSALVDRAQGTLDQDRFQALESVRMLGELRAKNEKLMAAVQSERAQRAAALADAHTAMRGLKPTHQKLATELAELVSAEPIKRDLTRARLSIVAALTPGTANEALEAYFTDTFKRLESLERKIAEIQLLYGNVGETIFRLLALGHFEVHPFATQRFEAELTKTRETARAEFSGTSNLKLRRGNALAAQFDATVGERITRMFVIAERESITWMRGVINALERPIAEVRTRHLERSARADKIAAAELDLAGKIAELQASLDVIHRKHSALADLHKGIRRFSGQGVDEEDEFPVV